MNFKSYKTQRISDHLVRINFNNTVAYYDNESITVYNGINFNRSKDFSEGAHDSKSLIGLLKRSPFPDLAIRKNLSRLTINVTQACNLKCKYCYAEHGNYNQRKKPLDLSEYIDTLGEVLKYYYQIELIQLFGGEPLLDVDKIRATCAFFNKAFELGYLKTKPKYAVVTNGVNLDDENTLKFLKTYRFSVTVSWDGPEEITNYLRGFPLSTNEHLNTYNRILNGISAARKNKIPISLESTYTNFHQQNKISVLDLLNYARKTINIASVHIVGASSSLNSDYRPDIEFASNDFFEAARVSVHRAYRKEFGVLDSAMDILEQLSKKKRVSGYCPAFTSQISLDIEGDVFPCFMSMVDSNNNLGSLKNTKWPSKKSVALFNQYRSQMEGGDFQRRHGCWYDSLIVGCAGADVNTTGKYGIDSAAVIHEAIISGVIVGLAEINL